MSIIKKQKVWKDTVHGYKAVCYSKSMAWALIRMKAHNDGVEVPMMSQVEEVK